MIDFHNENGEVVMVRVPLDDGGDRVGTVKELLIDQKNNTVEKIVVSTSRISGEQAHITLPYKPFGFTICGLIHDEMPENLEASVHPYEQGNE